MTDYMILFILKMLVALAPFLLLVLFCAKSNLNKKIRSRQFLMPVVAVVYSALMMLLSNKLNEWLIKFIESLPEKLASVSGWDITPGDIGQMFICLSFKVRELIDSLNKNFWVFFLANAVIIFVFIIIKRIAIKIFDKIFKDSDDDSSAKDFHDKVSGKFYHYFVERETWCVKAEYAHARDYVKTFYIASIIISVLLMLVSAQMYDMKYFKSIYYPAFAIMMLGEVYFYLNGNTQQEHSVRVLGENENAYKVVNYTLLRKFLKAIFNDKLLAESTHVNNGLFASVSNEEQLEALIKSEDSAIENYGNFMAAMVADGLDLDIDYLHSGVNLLEGKSILFNNPFYYDLIPYVSYPMNRTILSGKKVLIVLGRHGIEENVKQWVADGIEAVTNIPFLWDIEILGKETTNAQIGIISRSEIFNSDMLDANEKFFRDVDFCIILEPSKLVSTAQIGLNLIIRKIKEKKTKDITFCLCDKNCDGLVDAMSHILLQSLIEVSPTNKHEGTSSYMLWQADRENVQHRIVPNVAKYLGLGTELSFVALKNQVDETRWYGGETFPVSDQNWVSHQYYYDLMTYAGLPTVNEEMNEHFKTSPDFWGADVRENSYITVEDEFNNVFEILRDFQTRATAQGFVNVISSDYLLRDYMADNAEIFECDPKAIPLIVPDYARTERNVALRFLFKLCHKFIEEGELIKEFELSERKVFNLKKQIWFEIYKCYAGLDAISALSDDYKEAVNQAAEKTISWKKYDIEFTADVIVTVERFNIDKSDIELVYTIKDTDFIDMCKWDIGSAQFICEDEKQEEFYIGTELTEHIYQKYLPGQFFTIAGKYYEMLYLTANGQVLVRRAADHINSRVSYRQIRKYNLLAVKPENKIDSVKDIGGLRVSRENADVVVSTEGYYRMNQYNDFSTAKRILFESEVGIPERRYVNKTILKLEFPDKGDGFSDKIRYTITNLLNEVFRTIFAEFQPFIAAVTDLSTITDEEAKIPLTYELTSESCEIGKNCIYIIEDSQLDIGLLIAFERNIDRILEIITDYLSWHYDALDACLNPKEPSPADITLPEIPEDEEEEKGLLNKIKKFFKKAFKKKKGADGEIFKGEKKKAVEEKDETKHKQKTKRKMKFRKKDNPVTPETVTGEGEPLRPNAPYDPDDGSDDFETMFDNEFSDRFNDDDDDETEVVGQFTDIPEDPEYDPYGAEDDLYGNDDFGASDFSEEYEKMTGETDEEEIPQNGEFTDDYPEEGDETQSIIGGFKFYNTETDGEEEPESDGENIPEAGGEETPETDETSETDGDEPTPEGDETTPEDDVQPEGGDGSEDDTIGVGEVEPDGEDGEDNDGAGQGYDGGNGDGGQGNDGGNGGDDDDDGTGVVAGDKFMEDEELDFINDYLNRKRPKYSESYYLLYGMESEPAIIDVTSTLNYMNELGFELTGLGQTRYGIKIAEMITNLYDPNHKGARYCDFCGEEISGVEYEILPDGRQRCPRCGRTAIKTVDEFREIFDDVKRNLESFFGIRLNASIRVEMVSQRVISTKLKKAIVPPLRNSRRVLGLSVAEKRTGYTIYIEGGSPRLATMLTIAHELTHIWQHKTWNAKEILSLYGAGMNAQLYEGMAKWVEVQYAYLINEPVVAKREEITAALREDDCGYGFLRFRGQYPISYGTVITGETPFEHPVKPLDPEFCGPSFPMIPLIDKTLFEGDELKTYISGKKVRRKPPKISEDDLRKRIEGEVNREPGKIRRFYYETLTDEEKGFYDELIEGLNEYVPEFTSFKHTVTQEQMKKIVEFIGNDYPEIFWWKSWSYQIDPETDNVLSLAFNYVVDKEGAEGPNQQIAEHIPEFIEGINDTTSDFEVVLRVYENIIRLVDYDSVALAEQEKDPDYLSKVDNLRSLQGVFVDKKTVCAGYAKAFQFILNNLGVECIYVVGSTGNADHANHAWNMVKIEGEYYYVDVTWGDRSNTDASKDGGDGISYNYFCITTDQLLKDHTPAYFDILPKCTSTACDYFRRTGKFIEKYDFEEVKSIFETQLSEGVYSVQIKCSNEHVYKTLCSELIDKQKVYEILKYCQFKLSKDINTGSISYGTSDANYILTVIVQKNS